MKLTIEETTELGLLLLEKQTPLAPWIITVPNGDRFTCHGGKSKAIATGIKILGESNGRQERNQTPVVRTARTPTPA